MIVLDVVDRPGVPVRDLVAGCFVFGGEAEPFAYGRVDVPFVLLCREFADLVSFLRCHLSLLDQIVRNALTDVRAIDVLPKLCRGQLVTQKATAVSAVASAFRRIVKAPDPLSVTRQAVAVASFVWIVQKTSDVALAIRLVTVMLDVPGGEIDRPRHRVDRLVPGRAGRGHRASEPDVVRRRVRERYGAIHGDPGRDEFADGRVAARVHLQGLRAVVEDDLGAVVPLVHVADPDGGGIDVRLARSGRAGAYFDAVRGDDLHFRMVRRREAARAEDPAGALGIRDRRENQQGEDQEDKQISRIHKCLQ